MATAKKAATKKASPSLKVVKKPEFDATKSYSWKAEDTFPILGNEFEFTYKSLYNILNTEYAKTVLSANHCFSIMQKKLQEAVENGIAVETVVDPQEAQ